MTDAEDQTRLCLNTLAKAGAAARLPGYSPEKVSIGILHFGPGAFHRAHQAAYVDHILQLDPRWGICAVSLNSPDVDAALAPQDGLYTLSLLGPGGGLKVIGAIRQTLVAPRNPDAVFARFVDPAVKVVTMTVTEKGYRLDAQGRLDFAHPDVVHDLAYPNAPKSLVGWLVEGLRRRREAGRGGMSVISCDNLPDNGIKLRDAVQALAVARDVDLAAWIAESVRFPRTMVDSITPATDDALRNRVDATLGLHDAWPIQRETFTQWVIEDLGGPGPDWASAGAVVSDDVGAYEQAKLRLLNGAHSSLAYIGLLTGCETVFQAMQTPSLANFIRQLMVEDIGPTVKTPKGLDLGSYIDAILGRFADPAVVHRLSQIAWDGSQKLPIRLLDTVTDALEAGRSIDRLARPVAAWMRFLVMRTGDGQPLVDPLAERLLAIARTCSGRGADDLPRFLALREVFSAALTADPRFYQALVMAYDQLAAGD